MPIGNLHTEGDLEAFVRDRVLTPQAASSYAETIGNGSSTSFTIEHLLGTRDVSVTVYDVSSHAELPIGATLTSVVHTTRDTVTVTFAAAPASGAYRVVVRR